MTDQKHQHYCKTCNQWFDCDQKTSRAQTCPECQAKAMRGGRPKREEK